MCTHFRLSASPYRAHPSFWLLEALDSLVARSRRDPEGDRRPTSFHH